MWKLWERLKKTEALEQDLLTLREEIQRLEQSLLTQAKALDTLREGQVQLLNKVLELLTAAPRSGPKSVRAFEVTRRLNEQKIKELRGEDGN